MALIKAHKGAKTAVFSEGAWKSGQPQRYGWISDEGEEIKKKIPAEILEFATIRKKISEPVKDEPTAPIVEAAPVPEPKPKAKRKPKKKAE